MFAFFGGSSGKQSFTSVPTSGKPTLPVGSGPFNGGAAPDFQGIAVIGINMPAGYTGKLTDLQIAGVSLFSIDKDGNIIIHATINTNGNTITTGEGTLATGALSTNAIIKAVDYVITGFTDHTIVVNAASRTITLPSASARPGGIYCIKNTSLGTSTIVASVSGLVENGVSDSTSLVSALAHAIYQSDGTNWWKIA